jgi:hypothetical protein
MKKILISAIVIALFNGCKKDDNKEVKETFPQITINEPKQTIYHVGDTVLINVNVTDEFEMHEAIIQFITSPQNETLWSQKRHAHTKSITFNTFYILKNLPDQQKVDFVVQAENASGKTSSKTHRFEVHNH